MKLFRFYILFFLLAATSVRAAEGYYFFTVEDIQNIKSSANTSWGKTIVEGLKQEVDSRRKHSLRVPLMEGGHLHHYFCPVHNQMLEFDWDKPFEHYCRLCGKYWENDNRYDWAWINIVHSKNLSYLMANMYLYIITEDDTYAKYIRDMMLDYASKYPTYFEHNTNRKPTNVWSGRMFGQSLDEAVWASDAARAYSVARKIMTAEEIKKIENGYLKVCADMLLKRRGGGNWQVWHNSGLIALGVALQNDDIINAALNDPQCGYRQMMELHVYNDGWWNEGSPIYHYYPLRAMLLSADAVRCRSINLFDEKLHNMFASPAAGVYANLYFPAHNDGWYGESLIAQAKLYEIAYQRFNDNFLLDILKECYKYTERSSAEALQNPVGIVPNPKAFNRKSARFEDVGVGLLVSGTNTVVLKYGPHGGGHGHPDKLSISIHNGTKEIVTDMGTSAYGVPDFTKWYRKTVSHTTLTVDAKDQKETTGKLVEFKPTSNGGTIAAECNDAYPGVKMKRSLSLKGNKLTDTFTATSSDKHLYDYVIMLTDKPQFKTKGEPATLDDAEVYTRITKIEKRQGNKSFTCTVGNSKLTVRSLESEDFEIITGEGSGIPPTNPAIGKEHKFEPSFPLIIRISNKNLKIKAEWEIK